jgi:hypothetical protein
MGIVTWILIAIIAIGVLLFVFKGPRAGGGAGQDRDPHGPFFGDGPSGGAGTGGGGAAS